jgi:hypothetical protein
MVLELGWTVLQQSAPYNGTHVYYTVVNGNVSRVAFVSLFPAMAFELNADNPPVSAFLAFYPDAHEVQKIED